MGKRGMEEEESEQWDREKRDGIRRREWSLVPIYCCLRSLSSFSIPLFPISLITLLFCHSSFPHPTVHSLLLPSLFSPSHWSLSSSASTPLFPIPLIPLFCFHSIPPPCHWDQRHLSAMTVSWPLRPRFFGDLPLKHNHLVQMQGWSLDRPRKKGRKVTTWLGHEFNHSVIFWLWDESKHYYYGMDESCW